MARLAPVRAYLARHRLEALVVPSNDPHFSEYVADHWAARAWASGFTGSAGTLAVTRDRAALWTDSRYFLQAGSQLAGSGIELQKDGLPETPTLAEWLRTHLNEGAAVGVDGLLYSAESFAALEAALGTIVLKAVPDPFAEINPDRPPLPSAPAFLWEDTYSGEPASRKLDRLREAGGLKPGRAWLLTSLDEIAWLLNLRGADIPYNPLVIAYAAVEHDRVLLFADRDKFSEPDRERLARQGIEFRPYASFGAYLPQVREARLRPSRFGVAHYRTLQAQGSRILADAEGTVARLKAVKNPVEREGFRQAMLWDGAALVRFEMWLEDKVASETGVTELEAARKLAELRSASPLYRGESFAPIAGYADHGAIVHYAVTEASSRKIGRDSFLLVDSGGQYLCGTTDVTRTYHFGEPGPRERADYTAVLRGLIDLSAAVFPQGTRGTQLDVLARRPLWEQRANYLHGTGHGVGCFLNVHEGPQSIRMNENPVPFAEGMTTSNEPGLYREGLYGIRIENLLLCRSAGAAGFGDFLEFETLTLCPVQTRALDTFRLSEAQRAWLNAYHATVRERLSPWLDERERTWLRDRTRPV